MKRFLTMLLDYLFIFFFALIAGTLFLVLSFESKGLVAGQSHHFSKDILIYSILLIIPFIIMMISCTLMLYKIRHLQNPVSSAITYTVLCLVSWLGIYPLCQVVTNKFSAELPSIESITSSYELSKGYFRNTSSGTHYYLENSSDHVAPVVTMNNLIDTNDTPKFQNLDISDEIKPYSDSLIKQTMHENKINLKFVFLSVILQGIKYWNHGYLAWLCFCSLGFALCSGYCFIRFSSWRLINMFLCIVSSMAIILFNCIYFFPFFDSFRAALYQFFYSMKIFSGMVRLEVDVPLFFLNILTGLIFTISGFIISAVSNKRGNL